MAVMYCVAHAATEELVPAVGMLSGLTMCQAHGGFVSDWSSVGEDLPREARCTECGEIAVHAAYFVVEGRPMCIRHTADAVFSRRRHGCARYGRRRVHRVERKRRRLRVLDDLTGAINDTGSSRRSGRCSCEPSPYPRTVLSTRSRWLGIWLLCAAGVTGFTALAASDDLHTSWAGTAGLMTLGLAMSVGGLMYPIARFGWRIWRRPLGVHAIGGSRVGADRHGIREATRLSTWPYVLLTGAGFLVFVWGILSGARAG